MGETAVLSVQAHVFQIDPETKKKWLPSSTSSVKVAYYHDPSRKTYRIIAIESRKTLINSTVTANMSFTKTSPKFGQWSDHRANTVYGLGFSSESDLSLFSDKFTEAKTAAKVLLEERRRLKVSANSSTASTETNSGGSGEVSIKEEHSEPSNSDPVSPNIDTSPSNTSPVSLATSLKTEPSSNGSIEHTNDSDKDIESLKHENSKLKVALASSAQNVKKWESEMQTLRNNNAMLTTALEESTQHVHEWKRQLQKYKEECDTLRKKVSEAENLSKDNTEIDEIKKENEELKDVLSAVQVELENKTEECNSNDTLITQLHDKLKLLESDKDSMKSKVEQLEKSNKALETSRKDRNLVLQKKNQEMESHISSLLSIQKEFSKHFTS